MAQKVSVNLIDDLDGSVAEESIKFALDAITYTIDLSEENATELRDTLAHYISHSTRWRAQETRNPTKDQQPRYPAGHNHSQHPRTQPSHSRLGARARLRNQRPRPHLTRHPRRLRHISLSTLEGLLAGVTRTVLQTALDVEITDHLGYAKGDSAEQTTGNHRNATSSKTVHIEVGPVPLDVPRDRQDNFESKIVPKHSRRVEGFDDAITSLYAKGLTTGEIQAHLAEIYSTDGPRTSLAGSPTRSWMDSTRSNSDPSIACIRWC